LNDNVMSRFSRICWVILLVAMLSLIFLLVRSQSSRLREQTAEANLRLTNLQNELQKEQNLRVEAESEKSKAIAEITKLAGELELEKNREAQVATERDAYRKQASILEQQNANSPALVPAKVNTPILSGSNSEDKERSEAILCAGHLHQIGLAAALWAG